MRASQEEEGATPGGLPAGRAMDLLTVLRHDGTIESAAPGFAEALGVSRSTLAGRSLFTLAPDPDRRRLAAAWRALRPGGTPSTFVARMACESAELRWFSWQAVVDEQADLVLAVVREAPEIEEQRRARRRDLLLSMITENAPVAGVIADAEGEILEAVGLGGQERVPRGAQVSEVFSAAPEMVAAFRRGLRGVSSFERYSHGDTAIDAWLVPLANEDDGGALVCVLHEVTKEAQAELRSRAALELFDSVRQAILDAPPVILPVWEGVLCFPLVGVYTGARLDSHTPLLLDAIKSHQAQHVIIDLTGLQRCDTSIANSLVVMAAGCRLLGARTIVTGLHRELTQTLVALGIDLSSLTTLRTLKEGVLNCVRHRQAMAAAP